MPRLPRALVSYQHQLPALVAACCHAVAPTSVATNRPMLPKASGNTLCSIWSVTWLVSLRHLERLAASSSATTSVRRWRPPSDCSGPIWYAARCAACATERVATWINSAVFPPLIGPKDDQVFFQEPGVVEAVLETDTRASVRNILISASGVAAEVNTFLDGGDSILFTGMEGAPAPNLLTDEFLAGLTV